MYQLLCFCSFSAKHKELLNLIHFNIYQPLRYFDVLFTVDFLYLQYKIIVWKNTSKDIKDTLNKRIYFTVFPIRYFCVSGWFITFNIRNLCDLSLQCITGLPPFTATPFPQSSEATKYCSVRSLSSEELRSLGTKLQVSLIWSVHILACFFSEAGKSFWSAFSYYLTNDTEIFQAMRSQHPLFLQCSGMRVFWLCLNFFINLFSSFPHLKWGLKSFSHPTCSVKYCSFLMRKDVFKYVEECKNVNVAMYVSIYWCL